MVYIETTCWLIFFLFFSINFMPSKVKLKKLYFIIIVQIGLKNDNWIALYFLIFNNFFIRLYYTNFNNFSLH